MLYENIKQICEKKGLTIRQLEREAGLGRGTIAKWHNHAPKITNLQTVAEILKVNINKLLK